MRMVLEGTTMQDNLVRKTDERIKQYEHLQYMMKGQREEEQLKLKEQFEGFDNFDLKANQTIVKQMDNQSADLLFLLQDFQMLKSLLYTKKY